MPRAKPTTESPSTPATEATAISPLPHNGEIAARIWTPLQGDSIVVVGSWEQRIATLATSQYGHVSWRQLRQAAITEAGVRSRVKAGWLTRVAPGVYAVGHRAAMPHGSEVAALLGAPPATVLSHLTAARLWQIHDDPRADAAVDILITSGVGQRRGGIRTHRTVIRQRAAAVHVDRLPVTSPAHTVADIAAMLTVRELERALDEALARHLTNRVDLERALKYRPAGRGIMALQRLLARRGPLTVTRTEMEQRFLQLIRDANLPDPEVNVWLHGFEVDFYWRHAGLVVETDSFQWHSRRSAFERDRRKDAALTGAGLRVVRVTWDQMTDTPLEVVAGIAGRLAGRPAT